ncbi:TyeA family type III secretion system gatekeeper subunit [Vibrio caribbeanicus]|uniref:Type III secretion system effector delivery regulator TyeA domain-containing protein n=1 Tax=Vibrio caribbeanicus ATCC BAA-2122 TaxID=796620 RepID=E3BLU9_9VIBR|nr:hypothetical protein VIBC2010_01338 [Vibrio caribbeanicus ATCC BAA-2122]
MPYQVTDLMSDIINLIEQRWVGSEEVWSLVDSMELGSSEQKISFLRELHKLVRQIPIDVFNDQEQRQNLIQALQAALDEAIDKEEEEMWDNDLD